MSNKELLWLGVAAAIASLAIRLWIANAPDIAGKVGLPVEVKA